MMPIRPENRKRYPANWAEISTFIRFTRAKYFCECRGECGLDHRQEAVDDWGEEAVAELKSDWQDRCGAQYQQPHPITGSNVVLTVAHLDHTPENCDYKNLRAMCQRCHLRYDRGHHADTRRSRKAIRDLFAE